MNDEEEQSAPHATSDDVENHPEYWRFHFPKHDFKIWQYLNILGWKHRNRSYQAPPRPDGTPGQTFEDSTAVTRYLNSFAIPDVYTNLQFVDAPGDDNDDTICDNEQRIKAQQEREIGLALRKAILAMMYKKNDAALDNDDRFAAQEDG